MRSDLAAPGSRRHSHIAGMALAPQAAPCPCPLKTPTSSPVPGNHSCFLSLQMSLHFQEYEINGMIPKVLFPCLASCTQHRYFPRVQHCCSNSSRRCMTRQAAYHSPAGGNLGRLQFEVLSVKVS